VSSEDRGSYTLEKLVSISTARSRPGVLRQAEGRNGRLPTVLFNHSHGGGYTIGKQEFIEGREYMGKPPYAEFLTSLGYNALCFDAWIFGERSGRAELDFFKEKLWQGRVVWGMMVYDALKAWTIYTRATTSTPRAWQPSACPWAAPPRSGWARSIQRSRSWSTSAASRLAHAGRGRRASRATASTTTCRTC
jgi:hypothetical protein